MVPKALYTNSTQKIHIKIIKHQAELLSRFQYLERKYKHAPPNTSASYTLL